MSERPNVSKYHINIEYGQGFAIGDYSTVNNYYTTVQPYPELKDYVYDFGDVLSLAQSFVGRAFIFEALEQFRAQYDRGYFRIVADAGLGKTALAAAITCRFSATPFFISASQGVTLTSQCLNHLCASLIAQFRLEHSHLPARAGEDSAFLNAVLTEAAEAARKGDRPIWIVIDALDEADAQGPGRNVLLLPEQLPKGVYVVVTHRPGTYHLRTTAATPVREYHLLANDPNQQADITAYLRYQATANAKIARQLKTVTPSISVDKFVARLRAASEGNFQYLAYVLADIADRAEGSDPLNLDHLPAGLQGYYEQFWQHLEQVKVEEGRDEWKAFYKPLVGLLGAAGEPVTVEWLVDHTGRDEDDVEDALDRWQRFLSREGQGGGEKWRIVHQSFADFLSDKVDLTATHRRIAHYYGTVPERWSAHNGYAYRHLSAHLRSAGLADELFQLVDNQGWYGAQIKTDPSAAAYTNDLARAWAIAERMNRDAIVQGQAPSLIAREVKCALATVSVRNLLQNIPQALLTALVATKYWTPAQALVAARQQTNWDTRFGALIALAFNSDEPVRRTILEDALDLARPEVRPEILAELGRFEEALQQAHSLNYRTDRAKALARVAPYLDDSTRNQTLDEALDLAHLPYPSHLEPELLAVVAASFARVGRFEQALEIASGINIIMHRAWALLEVAAELAQVSRSEQALEVARSINSVQDRAGALARVAPHLPEPSRSYTLEEALGLVGGIEAPSIRADALAAVARYLTSIDHLDQALQLATSITDDTGRRNALAAIAPQLAKAGRTNQALEVARSIGDDSDRARALAWVAVHSEEPVRSVSLGEALRLVRRIGDATARAQALVRVAPYLFQPARSHYVDEACDVVSAAGDLLKAAEILKELALDVAELGHLEQAVQLTRSIQDVFYRRKALAAIAPQLAKAGRFDEALEVAESSQDGSDRVEVLVRIQLSEVLVQVALYFPEPSQSRILAEALEVLRSYNAREELAKALATVASHLASRGELERALEVARSIDQRYDFLAKQVLVKVAGQLAELGRFQEALDLANAIEVGHNRANALALVAPFLPEPIRSDSFNEAEERFRSIQLPDFRTKAVAELAIQLAKAGYRQRALEVAQSIDSDRDRATALGGVAPYLDEPARNETVDETFKIVCSIMDYSEQVKVLGDHTTLVSHLAPSKLYLLWHKALYLLAPGTRPNLLSDIHHLVPMIQALGGQEAVDDTARAIVDIGRWWP